MVVIRDDNRIPEILVQLEKLGQLKVRVGILGDKSGGHGSITMVELANIQEFGTRNGHIPSRSFVRSAYAENVGKWEQRAIQIVDKVTHGEMVAEAAYGQLGAFIARDIQRKIRSIQSPPNAPSTIAQKGSSNPLIDTGQLLGSVTWEVEGI